MASTGLQASNRTLVWTIVASQLGPPFMFSGVAVALPSLGDELRAGATSLGLVETLFLAGSLVFLLPVGRLADATDKRTLYKLGLLGFALMSIAVGSLSSMPLILVLRFLQGTASALIAVTGPALLADLVPPKERGRVYGASIGAIYGGLTLGPVVAGFLVEAWGWRAVFFVGAATLLAAFSLVHLMLPSSWRSPRRAVPLSSAALVMLAVLCLVGGSATMGQGTIGPLLLLAGVVLGACFVVLQRRLARPLLDVRALLGNRRLRSALLVQLLLYMNAFSSVFLLSLFVQVSLGHPARAAGQAIALGSVVMAAVAPLAGRLSDRYRPQTISALGVALVFASAVTAATLSSSSSLLFVTLILAVQGMGFGCFSSPNMTIIMNSVSAGDTSTASALSATARSLGMVSGMLFTTVLISLRFGNEPVALHPERLLDVVTTGFAILSGLAAVAIAVAVLRRRPGHSRGSGLGTGPLR